jgi:molybdenum cofactor biosynthesis protein B
VGQDPPIPDERRVPIATRALVLTVSDGVASGARRDESGEAVRDRLNHLGFMTDRATVADDRDQIVGALRAAVADHALVVTTGGTGLTPRDVTPQATATVLDYQVPGLAEAMRAAGRANTPMADLSRGVVGVAGRTLVVNVPGSPRAALESLAALEPTLRHALETLAGAFDHGAMADSRPDLPDPDPVPGDPATGDALATPAPDLGPSEGLVNFDPEPLHDFGKPSATDPWRDVPRSEGQR